MREGGACTKGWRGGFGRDWVMLFEMNYLAKTMALRSRR